MKKTLFKSVLCATLFVGALTSCNDVEDLYNPELVREQAKKALGLDIAADQDWNMTSVVTANVTLNEDALSDYSFRIYTADPLVKNSGAAILANVPVKTDAQGKASASFKFEMPSYLDYVYVARVDNHGRRWIGTSKIQNGVINKAFGESSSASTKAVDINASTFPEVNLPTPYKQEIIDGYLNDAAYQVSNINFKGKSGVIATIIGENITCNYSNEELKPSGKCTLVIGQGATLEIPNNGKVEIPNLDIIVANGGTLKFSGEMLLNSNSRLIVLQGGTVDNSNGTSDKNINVDATGNANCMIYNAGTIITNSIYLNQGAVIHNASTGIIKATTKIQFAGGAGMEDIINHGKIQAYEISSNGGGDHGTIYNGCLIQVTQTLAAARISVNENSAIEAPIISTNALYLRENSIARATTKLQPSKVFSLYYIGESGGKALFSTPTWELKDAPNFIDCNNVYIEIEDFTINGKSKNSDPYYVGQVFNQKISRYFTRGEAPLIISSEAANNIENADCTGKGNTPNENVVEELLNISNIYAFEDMSINGGDYDMNDVVLECTKLENNQISIKLVAAGATKKVYAFFRDTRSNAEPINLFGEVHEAFGQQSGVIINTGVDVNDLAPVEKIIDVAEGFLFSQHGDIYIVDYQNREAHISKFTNNFQSGDAPYGILVPITWKYPKEWVKITTAYPEFAAWAGGDDTASGWYTHPSSSNVY